MKALILLSCGFLWWSESWATTCQSVWGNIVQERDKEAWLPVADLREADLQFANLRGEKSHQSKKSHQRKKSHQSKRSI